MSKENNQKQDIEIVKIKKDISWMLKGIKRIEKKIDNELHSQIKNLENRMDDKIEKLNKKIDSIVVKLFYSFIVLIASMLILEMILKLFNI